MFIFKQNITIDSKKDIFNQYFCIITVNTKEFMVNVLRNTVTIKLNKNAQIH